MRVEFKERKSCTQLSMSYILTQLTQPFPFTHALLFTHTLTHIIRLILTNIPPVYDEPSGSSQQLPACSCPLAHVPENWEKQAAECEPEREWRRQRKRMTGTVYIYGGLQSSVWHIAAIKQTQISRIIIWTTASHHHQTMAKYLARVRARRIRAGAVLLVAHKFAAVHVAVRVRVRAVAVTLAGDKRTCQSECSVVRAEYARVREKECERERRHEEP